MKLNNKGFAITGILYTLLVLFMLTLISILAGLNTRKRIMDKSVETLENKYKYYNCGNTATSNDAPETGKYIYKSSNLTCYAYLSKGTTTNPNNIQYTTTECNNNKASLHLIEYCKR